MTSILHHHFQYHGYGETDVKLHIDNCSGQNKNNAVIGYLIALFTMCLIFNCNGTCNDIAIKSNYAQVVLVITGTWDVAYLCEWKNNECILALQTCSLLYKWSETHILIHLNLMLIALIELFINLCICSYGMWRVLMECTTLWSFP